MAKQKSAENNMLVQGTILAFAGIFVRLIGIVYRIPMTNIIGDEGNGYYSSAFQIYNIVLLLSSYSMPQAISRLISQRIAKRQYKNARMLFFCAVFISFLFGLIFSVLLYLEAGRFADWFSMPLAKRSIQILAPTVFVVSFLSALRGFFQGFGTMVITAISQIVEQIVNAVVSIIGVVLLAKEGHKTDLVLQNTNGSYAAAGGAAGGTLGTLAGAVAGLIVLLLFLRAYYPSFRKLCERESKNRTLNRSNASRLILLTLMPITVSAIIFNLVNFLDNILMSQLLHARAVTDEIIASKWGVFSGKYLLLVNIPIAFATALSSSAIPAIAQASSVKNMEEATHRINIVKKFTLMISFPCMIGMAVLATPIIRILFPKDASNASKLIVYGCAAIVAFSAASITNAILHGLGRMSIPIKNSIIALVIHTGLLVVLIKVFELDEYAVVISYMVFGLIVSALNLIDIRRIMYHNRPISANVIKQTYIFPLVASLIMGVLVYFSYIGIQKVLPRIVALLLSIFIGMLAYLIIVLKMHVVNENEYADLPMGKRIERLGRKLHLL
ncbi:MAG: polysaccharide biosynthesis protein [Lachnospiraceae bacterium]|nr:polysaccharide biosynthesis protein [Lachnospiraceae bacterium]